MLRCKHCNSIVPEGNEICKVCGRPLYEVEDDSGRKRGGSKISMQFWCAIIVMSVVLGFLLYSNDKKREEKMERQLAILEESTEMIQNVESDIHEVSSDLEMPEICYEDIALSYDPGEFIFNEKNSKLVEKHYENKDKTEAFAIRMSYSNVAKDITQNYIEEKITDEIGSYDKTLETYNGRTFSVYHFSADNKISDQTGIPVCVDVYVYYVGDEYYLYLESVSQEKVGSSGKIEEVLESIDIVEK